MRFPVNQPYKINNGFKASHLGIDIGPTPAGKTGVPIFAPEFCTVVGSGDRPTFEGQYLVLLGGSGKYYYFGHFAERRVAYNQKVQEGAIIGIMGMTGKATGIHTHHEVRSTRNGGQVNPLDYYKNIGDEEVKIGSGENWFWRFNRFHEQFIGRPLSRGVFNAIIGGDAWKTLESWSDHPESGPTLEARKVGQIAIKDRWDLQIYNLQAEVKKRDKLIAEIQKKADLSDSLQKKIDDLTAEKQRDTDTGNAFIRWIGGLFNKGVNK